MISENRRLLRDAGRTDPAAEKALPADRAPEGGSTDFPRIGPLALIPSVLAELGVTPAKFLSFCGPSADSLNDPERVLPIAKVGELSDACLAATQCPHFGLLVGQKSSWADFGPVGELFRNAPTLEDAFGDLAACYPGNDENGMFFLSPSGEAPSLCHAVYQCGEPHWAAFLTDVALASVCQIARALTGVEPIEVQLARGAPPDPTPYARHYHAPVRFDSEKSALVYSSSDLASPIPGADPEARQQWQWRRDQNAAAHPSSIVSQTRRAIVPLISSGNLSLSGVAKQLSTRPRTLNRRLVQERTSFQAEVERLRYDLARQLLANTALPITQVCSAFGYSAVSAFSRSFRRWSGLTPSEWRERQVSRPPR